MKLVLLALFSFFTHAEMPTGVPLLRSAFCELSLETVAVKDLKDLFKNKKGIIESLKPTDETRIRSVVGKVKQDGAGNSGIFRVQAKQQFPMVVKFVPVVQGNQDEFMHGVTVQALLGGFGFAPKVYAVMNQRQVADFKKMAGPLAKDALGNTPPDDGVEDVGLVMEDLTGGWNPKDGKVPAFAKRLDPKKLEARFKELRDIVVRLRIYADCEGVDWQFFLMPNGRVYLIDLDAATGGVPKRWFSTALESFDAIRDEILEAVRTAR